MRWRALMLLGGLALSLSAPAARAQDEAEEEARELFLEGATHYEAEDYAAAADAFERSYARRPVPVVLFNLAQALRFAGRPGAALSTFRHYLAEETDPGAQRRAAVEAAIGELEGEVGSLQLVVRGAESYQVEVDGHPVVRVDLARPFPVGRGRHEITLRAPGHAAQTRDVTIEAGRAVVLRISLTAVEGTLSVESDEPGARVLLDGEELGQTPLTASVGAGTHELEVTRAGHEPQRRTIHIVDGEELRLDLSLEPRQRLRDRWWLWAIVGGVVVGALAITLAVGVTERESEPLEGTLPTIQALQWSTW